jgi:DNA-binding PadR family transcriptional regulator
MLDWAGESQYYVEPKRLARLGYLDARKEPGRTRERTVYTLTDKGLEALREWAGTPARFTPVKSEPLLRVLISDLVGTEVTRDSLDKLREDIADLSARLDESEQTAEELPHRRAQLLLVNGFLRRLLDLYLDLVEDFERELAPRG